MSSPIGGSSTCGEHDRNGASFRECPPSGRLVLARHEVQNLDRDKGRDDCRNEKATAVQMTFRDICETVSLGWASVRECHPKTAAYTSGVAVKRIKPNILSERFDESRAFYNDVIGLNGGDGLDWILFFGTDQPEVQLSVMKLDIKAHVHPDVSIEVDDVDAVHDRARAAGAEIVYPLTDEEWGLRRFFVRDPNGAVINVTEHR
jgi:catechol 2,3-dioxygenase-like lactoylglutathione lyase family enzyme